jgi:N-sulfoglucosamine sulfohydrolase
MKRREFLGTGVSAGLGAAASGLAAGNASAPNIIYIIVHDLGTALSCYGEKDVQTPRLDEFASQGVRFVNYLCNSTPCSPSRSCIMTGRYAHSNGLIGLANKGWTMPPAERTAVDYLNDAGYETVNIGGQHERIRTAGPNPHRFKKLGPARRKADLGADDVSTFLKVWKHTTGPLYLNVYMQDPHAPWDRPEFQDRYKPDSITPPPFLPNTPRFRKSLSQFYGSVTFTDTAIGRILDTVRQTGMHENTLVIFTTDHGISFPRAKSTLYDPGLTTALMMRWPGRIKPGRVENKLLGNVDLLPTMLELAGAPPAKAIQGRSFAPLAKGLPYTPNREFFGERNFHDDFDPMRCVRTDRHKLIRNFGERDRYRLPSEADASTTPAAMRKSGKPRPFEELYDLEKDPNEFNNVAADPAYESVLMDLRQRLDKWMEDTGDFMRGGKEFVFAPSGANQPE